MADFFPEDFFDEHFKLIENCKGISQANAWHPEGDVFIHTLQVTHYALREATDIDTALAALLHDVGKVHGTINHDKTGAVMIEGMASPKTIWLVKNHLRIKDYLLGRMRRLGKCKELSSHPWFTDLVQLARWDWAGRDAEWNPIYDRTGIIKDLNKIANNHFEESEGK